MNGDRFDLRTRNVPTIRTRRTVFGTIAGAVATVLGIAARPTEIEARREAKQERRPNRGQRRRLKSDGPCGDRGGRANRCQRDRDCCTGICQPKRKRKFGRCRCRQRGQRCTQDRNCCRNGGQTLVCTAGTCVTPPPPPGCGTGGPCRVFRTAQGFQGNLGGAVGGDARCQTAADTAGLGGTFMAWLSDETTSPTERFFRSPEPYVLLDGTVIAEDWNDLIDGELQNPINRTEDNVEDSFLAWTGTDADGTLDTSGSASARTCNNWSSSNSEAGGSYGSNAATDAEWSVGIHQTQFCSISVPLYCFEQAPPG